eukprot:2527391-Prorocentrum_lima.AAC.1
MAQWDGGKTRASGTRAGDDGTTSPSGSGRSASTLRAAVGRHFSSPARPHISRSGRRGATKM